MLPAQRLDKAATRARRTRRPRQRRDLRRAIGKAHRADPHEKGGAAEIVVARRGRPRRRHQLRGQSDAIVRHEAPRAPLAHQHPHHGGRIGQPAGADITQHHAAIPTRPRIQRRHPAGQMRHHRPRQNRAPRHAPRAAWRRQSPATAPPGQQARRARHTRLDCEARPAPRPGNSAMRGPAPPAAPVRWAARNRPPRPSPSATGSHSGQRCRSASAASAQHPAEASPAMRRSDKPQFRHS